MDLSLDEYRKLAAAAKQREQAETTEQAIQRIITAVNGLEARLEALELRASSFEQYSTVTLVNTVSDNICTVPEGTVVTGI